MDSYDCLFFHFVSLHKFHINIKILILTMVLAATTDCFSPAVGVLSFANSFCLKHITGVNSLTYSSRTTYRRSQFLSRKRMVDQPDKVLLMTIESGGANKEALVFKEFDDAVAINDLLLIEDILMVCLIRQSLIYYFN